MRRLRVALIRGPYLGPFEAQNYEPLLDRFDVRAYILPQNRFDLSASRLPTTTCFYPDARFLGGRSLINAFRSRLLRERYPMPGIGRIVRSSDVVHTFEGWYTCTRQAAAACARFRIPLVITHWDTLPYSRTLDRNCRETVARAYQIASRVLAATQAARRALISDGVPDAKIIVQAMGVDSERFSPRPRDSQMAAKLGLHENDFVYLFVGRLAPDKGIRILLDALERSIRAPEMQNAKLLLLGSGPDLEWIRQRAASIGLGKRVLIHPPVPYEEVHRWYHLGDVFVFPSVPQDGIEEQFGYALVEAMSSALPVITTYSGGIPDVVQDAALLVPPGNAESLAQAMLRLKVDAAGREDLRGRARALAVRSLSSSVVAARLSDLYQELCSS